MSMHRRQFLSLTTIAAGGALLTRVAFARADGRPSRFVLVILRGALDGLAAVPPYGDRDYPGLRREFALRAPGEHGAALPLDGFFGLHPSLVFLQQCYSERELIVLHALASPYRERSHFDGQDVLENGGLRPHASQSGWLNRALAAAPATARGEAGVALGQNVPLVMRGPAAVTSWSPSRLSALDEDTLARIADLYATDKLLSTRLADALAADALAKPQPAQAKRAPYAEVARAAAGFLRQEDGPKVAVFDTNGWDTHANEGGAEGQLAGRLAALDVGLATLRQELGPVWRDTAVLLVTEFGRTAAINGTRGTDHGTATAAFLLGGAVAGGRVIADWPGLAARHLYQGRDLAPTLDLRSVLKGLLAEHLSVPSRALEQAVFPDSTAAKLLRGLVRA
ncbi:MAG TPA: DUF1501 domain-containing protein [Steroidobacteraceae bacterium]|jgi:uncharacterized protein (DUF1501 family)|nr:DUF1501 domain-containing protein [Steroidobacteraceae bacterium]